jgi:ubiquinone/menaquinone biosynthesis C-methylase UbiE
MGLYSRHILPSLIQFAMSQDDVMKLRAAHVPSASGVVLEVGIGPGLNLPLYTPAVTKLYGIDPSAELLEVAKRRVPGVAFPVELVQRAIGEIPLQDASIDTAVITWTLCSIEDPAGALREVRRVVKPGGSLIFIEHGASPDAGVRSWQRRLTPIWKRLAGGCHLDRKIDQLVRDAGFTTASLKSGYIPGPRFATYMYEGHACR